MTREEIAARIRTFLEEEFPDQGTALTNSTSLLDEWFVDSFGIVLTVLFLESAFAIKIARSDINGTTFANVDSLTEMVASRLAAPKAD